MSCRVNNKILKIRDPLLKQLSAKNRAMLASTSKTLYQALQKNVSNNRRKTVTQSIKKKVDIPLRIGAAIALGKKHFKSGAANRNWNSAINELKKVAKLPSNKKNWTRRDWLIKSAYSHYVQGSNHNPGRYVQLLLNSNYERYTFNNNNENEITPINNNYNGNNNIGAGFAYPRGYKTKYGLTFT
jgi:hypothetical protein